MHWFIVIILFIPMRDGSVRQVKETFRTNNEKECNVRRDRFVKGMMLEIPNVDVVIDVDCLAFNSSSFKSFRKFWKRDRERRTPI